MHDPLGNFRQSVAQRHIPKYPPRSLCSLSVAAHDFFGAARRPCYENHANATEAIDMKTIADKIKAAEGKIGYILLWLLGIPIPILFAIFLLRGCD